MSYYFSQFFKKLRYLFSSSETNEVSETPEKSSVKRKYCEIGVGTGEDLEDSKNPPVKKVNLEAIEPPPGIPAASSTIEMRRKCCTNFGDLVEFGDAFGLPPPTLISGQISVDPTTTTNSVTTTTTSPTSTTPTTTSASTTTTNTTTAPTKTAIPTDDKTKPTDPTAKIDDVKTEKEKQEEEEFIKSHEVHVVDPPPEIPPVTTDPNNPTPSPPPQPVTPPPPP
ncbi:hypothetical protein Fcan01_25446 [Folsomia candida]|uniref:Uncharacterized protein n=1 Tax=Folsomia candida TaxID=158441 RepID=A0A226D698_FOLCA|nr:hypothetical protein Fcan01_25446 [Folsomia candida]